MKVWQRAGKVTGDGLTERFIALFFTSTCNERGDKHMDMEQIKYYTVSDDEDGILLADIDETTPSTDDDGNLQYYSVGGRYVFSADDDE